MRKTWVPKLDIVGKVPFELVIQIFKSLGPSAPQILQRVSKTWQSRLITQEVLEIHTQDWYNDDDTQLVCQSITTDKLIIAKKKSEAMLRLINNNPARAFTVQTRLYSHQHYSPKFIITPTMMITQDHDKWVQKRDFAPTAVPKNIFQWNHPLNLIHASTTHVFWADPSRSELNAYDLASHKVAQTQCDCPQSSYNGHVDAHGPRLFIINGREDPLDNDEGYRIIIWQSDKDSLTEIWVDPFPTLMPSSFTRPIDQCESVMNIVTSTQDDKLSLLLTVALAIDNWEDCEVQNFLLNIDYGALTDGEFREVLVSRPTVFEPVHQQNTKVGCASEFYWYSYTGPYRERDGKILMKSVGNCVEIDAEARTYEIKSHPLEDALYGSSIGCLKYGTLDGSIDWPPWTKRPDDFEEELLEDIRDRKFDRVVIPGPRIVSANEQSLRQTLYERSWPIPDERPDLVVDPRFIVVSHGSQPTEVSMFIFDPDLDIRPEYFE